jgi:hypothetical protein
METLKMSFIVADFFWHKSEESCPFFLIEEIWPEKWNPDNLLGLR